MKFSVTTFVSIEYVLSLNCAAFSHLLKFCSVSTHYCHLPELIMYFSPLLRCSEINTSLKKNN